MGYFVPDNHQLDVSNCFKTFRVILSTGFNGKCLLVSLPTANSLILCLLAPACSLSGSLLAGSDITMVQTYLCLRYPPGSLLDGITGLGYQLPPCYPVSPLRSLLSLMGVMLSPPHLRGRTELSRVLAFTYMVVKLSRFFEWDCSLKNQEVILEYKYSFRPTNHRAKLWVKSQQKCDLK